MVEQFAVRTNLPPFKAGTILSPPYLTDTMNLPHGAGKAAQEITLEVTGALSAAYSVQVEGETVTYVPESGDDVADIADGLEALLNGNPLIRGLFSAESDGTDTVTLTALLTRVEYDVQVVAGAITLVETTAATDGGVFPVAVAVYVENGLARQAPSSGTKQNIIRGVSVFQYDEEQPSVASGADMAYPARFDVLYMRRGVVGVDTAPDAVKGGIVYLGVDNADDGKFFATNSADREPLAATQAEWDGPNRLLLKLA